MTEQTEIRDGEERNCWVLYDGDCPMCVRLAGRLSVILRRYGFDIAPLQSPWVQSRLGFAAGDRPAEMVVLSSSGNIYGGADAIVFLMRSIWWAMPLYVLVNLPLAMLLMRRSYKWIARRRAEGS